jgi:CRISPR-associated protein Cmr1
MLTHEYELKLAAPAFLGDAMQKGAWRAPPLKALLREWWRVAVAPLVGNSVPRLKEREALVFGTAADGRDGASAKSKVRLALDQWRDGTCRQWPEGEGKVIHPEVKDPRTGSGRLVGAELYLGFGPLDSRAGLKNGAALQANESNRLKLAYPDELAEEMAATLALANWFGTVGGRSRNGWGSLAWRAAGETPALAALDRDTLLRSRSVRPLEDCLRLDWPHAIGSDGEGVLVWRSTEHFADWRAAMTLLARTKIVFRTGLGFTTGDKSGRTEPRHLLAYPVTRHSVRAWGNDRIANTLRFKLLQEPEGVRALIYHTPCKPTLPHQGPDLLGTWQRVHRWLDVQPELARLA